jgi:hypothetical protein
MKISKVKNTQLDIFQSGFFAQIFYSEDKIPKTSLGRILGEF